MKTEKEKDKDKDNTECDQRLRKELKEKSKLLEEKLKLLRTKEVEFRRVTLSKDKAAKEVNKKKRKRKIERSLTPNI